MRPTQILVGLLIFTTIASADLKIKTRTTVMGRSNESSVYIKGPRQRTEMSYGGHGGSVSIMQCDQKRMVTVSGNHCMVMPFGSSGETSCPAVPSAGAMARAAIGLGSAPPPPPKKGGVLTITRNSTDTGERQEMFGYKARHIKSSMSVESSPDACSQSHMKMEVDGWYADLTPGFSCGGDESYRAMACNAGGRESAGCTDRVVMKGGGGGNLGFPMKQSTTIISEQGTFTTSTEVLELSVASLDANLFDMPAGCEVMDMGKALDAMTPTASTSQPPAPAATPAAQPAVAPAPAPAPTIAPKTAGVIRIGVVKLKDLSSQGLPTDNLNVNLLSEFARHQFEPVLLDTESPHASVEQEARAKQCDYLVYTTSNQVVEPGSGGLSALAVPKGMKLDPAKAQALSSVTLYKLGKPQPELKDLLFAAEGDRFGVDAVMETFVKESDKVAQQIAEDAHPNAVKPKTVPKAAAGKAKRK
jgi:hypothetical protein